MNINVSKKNNTSRINLPEMLGNTVSNIAPSTTVGVNIPMIIALVGDKVIGMFLLTICIIILLAMQIGILAYHLPSAGGTYSYIAKTLNPFIGYIIVINIISIIPFSLGYAPLMASSLFGISINFLFGIKAPRIVIAVIAFCIIFCSWYLARNGIVRAAKFAFVFELISLAIIIIISTDIIINFNYIDYSQFTNLVSPKVFNSQGLIWCIFSFIGFQTAGHLALESKDEKKYAPISMVVSVVFTGFIFMLSSYTIVLAYSHMSASVYGKINVAPFDLIGALINQPIIGPINDLAMSLALIAGTISSINTASRMIYSMSLHGILPQPLSIIHEKYKTPFRSVDLTFILYLPLIFIVIIFNMNLTSVMDSIEDVVSLQILIAWIFCSVGVIVILHRLKRRVGFIFQFIISAIVVIPFLLYLIIGVFNPIPSGMHMYLIFVYFVVTILAVIFYFFKGNGGYRKNVINSFISKT